MISLPVITLDRLVFDDTQDATPPGNPAFRLFQTDLGGHLFLADGSRVYDLDKAAFEQLTAAARHGVVPEELKPLLAEPAIDDRPPDPPPLNSLSLAIAQRCNLGCVYCYAEQGDFGRKPQNMSADTALAAVDRLLEHADPERRVNLAFMGGEPLINRDLLRETTRYAAREARKRSVPIGFSVTTNATLLTAEDARFFEAYGFAVTVSIDGVGRMHDRLRPYKRGAGSYEDILRRVSPVLEMQRAMQVSARVTVTPQNLDLPRTLDEFIALGFHTVGFSPLLNSPAGAGEMDQAALAEMLRQMVACGRTCESHLTRGDRYPFSNLVTALEQIHRGSHRPYPCGAGGGYMGVSAEGGLYACHRFVENQAGEMGDVTGGVDSARQTEWLTDRHVHRQEPCSSCWARYLCGGGCHHEVLQRGRPACDYVRGWLEYCLTAYVRLRRKCPEYFSA